jgi:hypothetical protein
MKRVWPAVILFVVTFMLLPWLGEAIGAEGEITIRIFTIGHYVTGDRVPADAVRSRFYLHEHCQLPIAGAENMWRFQQLYGTRNGCWGATLGDHHIIVLEDGTEHDDPLPYQVFPHAILHADGSVTITEPDYNSDTFMGQVVSRMALEHLKRNIEATHRSSWGQ